jgi:hypothetical protein
MGISKTTGKIVQLSSKDAQAVHALGSSSYQTDYEESMVVVKNRLALYPPGCLGYFEGENLWAYLLAFPGVRKAKSQ